MRLHRLKGHKVGNKDLNGHKVETDEHKVGKKKNFKRQKFPNKKTQMYTRFVAMAFRATRLQQRNQLDQLNSMKLEQY